MRFASLSWSLTLGLLGCSTASSASGADPGDDDGGTRTGTAGDTERDPPDIPDATVVDSAAPFAEAADAGGHAAEDGGDAGSCAGFAYCEDFESYDAGPLPARFQALGPWVVSIGGVLTATIDAVRPHTGRRSLHVVLPVGGQAGAMLTSPTVAQGLVAGNDLFARAMIYFVGTPGDGGVGLPLKTHWMIFGTAGTSDEVGGPVSINLDGSGDINYQARAGTTFELEAPGSNPSTNAWHCIQWELDGSQEIPLVVTDHARVWMDGQPITDVPKSEGWYLATPWSSFQFGLTHLQTSLNPVEYFMDDFALDGAMVPCP